MTDRMPNHRRRTQIKIMKRILLLLCAGWLPGFGFAQHFTFKAKVPQVDTPAFYKIGIHSGIVGRSQGGLQDLRIFDNDGREVPYFLKQEEGNGQVSGFENYPFSITRNGKESILIVENRKKQPLRQFLFEMKNAEASRLVRISGSDNNADWFVVKDSFYFEPYSTENAATVQKLLSFPETDYAFYKVEIYDGQKEAPLNIIRVGRINTAAVSALYQPIADLDYRIVDSARSTFIFCKLKQANKIDRLVFDIDAPEFYKRSVTISRSVAGRAYNIREGRADYTSPEMDAELISTGSGSLDCAALLGGGRYDAFTIRVQNGDDAPLHIRLLRAFQYSVAAVARLEKGKTYFLYFGDSLLTAPAYDIVFFEQHVPANIAGVEAGPVLPKEQAEKDEYNGSREKWIVWVGLGIAGVTILLLTLNMMKKMKPA